MYGIFGYVTNKEEQLRPILIEAAQHLTYRGYDSVGAHNGSVVNNVELREQFIAEGMTVRLQNDGETCVHAMGRYINRGYQFIDAIRLAYGDLQGAYALVIGRTDEDKLYAFKKGSVKERRSRCKRELRRELGGRYVKSGRPIQQHLW